MEPARRGLQKIALELIRTSPEQERPMIAWPLACGIAVAEKTRAIGFNDGILTIEVPDAMWRTELRGMSSKYLAALRQVLGNSVQRIEFVLSPPSADRTISR
jgi:predicted nucleic acid-binding Zn ribbon protein